MDDQNNKPLSSEDIYGASGQSESKDGLVYEETPIIEPINKSDGSLEQVQISEPSPKLPGPLAVPELSEEKVLPPSKKNNSFIKVISVFLVLVALGIGVSYLIRPYVPALEIGNNPDINGNEIENQEQNTDDSISNLTNNNSEKVTFQWQDYSLDSRLGYKLDLKLPENTLTPSCDGANCPSVGSYLPGGTRFTIAVTKHIAPVSNFSSSKISDASGVEFENIISKEISGKPAIEYKGDFTGRTTGGYAYIMMHGVMILADSSTTIEINHFTPAGINADFDADDVLFEEILKSVSF